MNVYLLMRIDSVKLCADINSAWFEDLGDMESDLSGSFAVFQKRIQEYRVKNKVPMGAFLNHGIVGGADGDDVTFEGKFLFNTSDVAQTLTQVPKVCFQQYVSVEADKQMWMPIIEEGSMLLFVESSKVGTVVINRTSDRDTVRPTMWAYEADKMNVRLVDKSITLDANSLWRFIQLP